MKNPYDALEEAAKVDGITKIFVKDTLPYYVHTLNGSLESIGYRLVAVEINKSGYDDKESLRNIEEKYQ